jgi:hypothetical protein
MTAKVSDWRIKSIESAAISLIDMMEVVFISIAAESHCFGNSSPFETAKSICSGSPEMENRIICK